MKIDNNAKVQPRRKRHAAGRTDCIRDLSNCKDLVIDRTTGKDVVAPEFECDKEESRRQKMAAFLLELGRGQSQVGAASGKAVENEHARAKRNGDTHNSTSPTGETTEGEADLEEAECPKDGPVTREEFEQLKSAVCKWKHDINRRLRAIEWQLQDLRAPKGPVPKTGWFTMAT